MNPEGVARIDRAPGKGNMKVPLQSTVMATIAVVLPKASATIAAGIWQMLAGWAPANASVHVDSFDPNDTTGGSARAATAVIAARYRDGDPKVHRHASDAFAAYVATYGGNRATDPAIARSAISMAVGKVARDLRDRGYNVGVAMANVGSKDDPTYVVVPYTYG